MLVAPVPVEVQPTAVQVERRHAGRRPISQPCVVTASGVPDAVTTQRWGVGRHHRGGRHTLQPGIDVPGPDRGVELGHATVLVGDGLGQGVELCEDVAVPGRAHREGRGQDRVGVLTAGEARQPGCGVDVGARQDPGIVEDPKPVRQVSSNAIGVEGIV